CSLPCLYTLLTHIYITSFCFYNTPPITEIYTLSLHDALPIYEIGNHTQNHKDLTTLGQNAIHTEITESADKIQQATGIWPHLVRDRKSTRLNSSHVSISYAVFCLKKKNITTNQFNSI